MPTAVLSLKKEGFEGLPALRKKFMQARAGGAVEIHHHGPHPNYSYTASW